MAEWTSGDVIANGIRIHYYRTGGNKPPIVLNHGATDAGLCWTPIARALEAEFDVIMPDARGHGLSEAPASGYTTADRAADLAGLIGALGLVRPVVAGHSMGANTTLYFVANYPDLPRAAILEDPGLRAGLAAMNGEQRRKWLAQFLGDVVEKRAMSREALIALCRKESPTWPEEELGPWADSKRQLSPSFVDSFAQPDTMDWQVELPKIGCPTLLITSDPEKGGIVTPEVAAEATRLLPSLKSARLTGAGHNIRREQTVAFVKTIRGFLAEV
jgi:N-formylmaleamate deformylase